MSSPQLRTLDYRNGKYQGFTSQDLKANGLGMLIDDLYGFVLGQWKNNNLDGPVFMVYPDQSILYGYVEQGKIGSIVSYQVSQQYNMVISKNNTIIVVDLLKSQSILTFKIDKKLLDQQMLSSVLSMKQQSQKNALISSQINLLSQDHYTSAQQKYQIYGKKLSSSLISQQMKTFPQFIQKHFSHPILQTVSSKQQYTINFTKCAISLFMKMSIPINQLKQMGSWNKYQGDYQFIKRIHHKTNGIEEQVGQKINQYSAIKRNRSNKCIIQLQNFHQKAVTYVNRFFNINYLYQIKNNLQKINQLINLYVLNKFAQVQLENSRLLINENTKKGSNQSPIINYSLNQVQQQIYDAVNRKRQHSNKKIYPDEVSRVLQRPLSQNRPTQSSRSQVRIAQPYNKVTNSPYKKPIPTQDHILQSRLSSKTFYHPNTPPIKSNTIYTKKVTHNKFSYLNQVQNVKYGKFLEHNQSMRHLTNDFQNIQKQIEMVTPRKREPSFRLDNQAYRKGQLKSYTDKKTNVQYQQLTQKKVFKYLPQ